MISTFMILTALTTAALGKVFLDAVECNFSEPTGDQQCFGAEGQPLLFHLPATADREIQIKKGDKQLILKVKNQAVKSYDKDYIHQIEGYTRGTLNLGNATKKHSGDYTLEEFHPNGTLVKKTNVHLQIQAPVSEAAVSQVCLSPDQMKVSCSSEGDGVKFTLTLDGQSLIQTRDYSLSPSTRTTNPPSLTGGAAEQDNSNVTINLHGQLTGDLICNVQNNVSRGQTVFHLTSCKASVPVVTAVVRMTVISLVLVTLCLGIYHLHNKTRNKTVNEGISKEATDPM